MSFRSTSRAVLTGAAAVTALVPAASISFETGTQGRAHPLIILSVTSMTPGNDLDNGGVGAKRLDNYMLSADVFAEALTDVEAIAEQVRIAFEANAVTRYILDNELSGYDDLPRSYRITLEFSCWYQSTS